MNFVLFITGPTASGKTSFAIEIAKEFNGEVVCCDSMQIYKDMNIGTAKPTEKERRECPHHMIDVAECCDEFTVQQYVLMATQVIDDIISRGKLPIVVGGTGLYIKSLMYDYSFAKTAKDVKIREHYNKLLNEKGKEYLHQLLKTVDEVSASNIHENDTKRVIRALEIYDLTLKPKSSLNIEKNKRYDSLLFVLDIDREVLYSNIDKRVDTMFDLGLEKEVENLYKKNKNFKSIQSMQAIGYKEFFDYFDGNINLDDVKNLIKLNSRHYAKRQMTFFRKLEDAIFISPMKDKEKIYELINNKIKNK